MSGGGGGRASPTGSGYLKTVFGVVQGQQPCQDLRPGLVRPGTGRHGTCAVRLRAYEAGEAPRGQPPLSSTDSDFVSHRLHAVAVSVTGGASQA